MAGKKKKVGEFASSKKSVIADRVHPKDFHEEFMMYSCEQCSHFAPKAEKCTLGFPAHLHRKAVQLKRYYINGHMTFCRFLEID